MTNVQTIDALDELLGPMPDHIQYYPEVDQGSDTWLSMRCGLLTASEMKHIITPAKLQYASNDKERAHLYELVAQRITGYVEPHYIGDDMLRGIADEVEAKILYDKHYQAVESMGFITNNKWGFTIGYSPDGLVGTDGQLECKSRRQKFQVETILGSIIPPEYMIQLQTGLAVSERKWCDFISYCGGMPMVTMRVFPDEEMQDAIITAAGTFHQKMENMLGAYREKLASKTMKLIPTVRKIEQEILA